MTLAQFFEIRYNKSFRLFTGLLAFFAGMLNFGIIPAVGARTMVYFFGLPETVSVWGAAIPTYVVLMAIFLSIAAFVATTGGVVTVMLINTLEGIISQIFYLIIICAILSMFTWKQMHDVLLAQPTGQSLVNPFDASGVKDFNIWTVFMGLITGLIAAQISWQKCQCLQVRRPDPHEGRMGGLLSFWLNTGKAAVVTLLALAAVTYLKSPDFSAGAAHVQATVHQIANEQAQEEMAAPIALAYLLPVGVKGIFCVILLMGIFGGDATHLHSWAAFSSRIRSCRCAKSPLVPRPSSCLALFDYRRRPVRIPLRHFLSSRRLHPDVVVGDAAIFTAAPAPRSSAVFTGKRVPLRGLERLFSPARCFP